MASKIFLLYCNRCNEFIGELKLFGVLPEAFYKQIICKKCLTRDYEVYTSSLKFEPEFRYYMGRHKVLILGKGIKHIAIEHLEDGYVGNKREGYKKVKVGDYDITVPRLLRKKKRD